MARKTFGERYAGVAPQQTGLEEAPEQFRIALWNTFEGWLFDHVADISSREIAKRVFVRLNWPTDTVRYSDYDNRELVKEWFFRAEWHEVYEFVEWLLVLLRGLRPDYQSRSHLETTFGKFVRDLGQALERSGSPYSLVNYEFVPITSKDEISEVVQAMQVPFEGARTHIEQALRLLSLKPEPDYRNSIKESVSGVESALKEATGIKNADLPALLKAFESKHKHDFHPAFRNAISALYGWTSDESGLRHSIFGDVKVDRADARFMLVVCSAFVNFLVQHVR